MISKQFRIDADILTIDDVRKYLTDNLTQFETIPAWGINKKNGVIVRENESFGALVILNSKKKIIKIYESIGSRQFSLSVLTVTPATKEKLVNLVYNSLKEKFGSNDSDVPHQEKSNTKFGIGLFLTIISLLIIAANLGVYSESGHSENLSFAFIFSMLGFWGIKLMIKSKRQ